MVATVIYPSPTYRYDPIARIMITEKRNTSNGALVSQAPLEAVVREADIAALSGDGSNGTVVSAPQAAPGSSAGQGSSVATRTVGNEPMPKSVAPAATDSGGYGPQANDTRVTPPNQLYILA